MAFGNNEKLLKPESLYIEAFHGENGPMTAVLSTETTRRPLLRDPCHTRDSGTQARLDFERLYARQILLIASVKPTSLVSNS